MTHSHEVDRRGWLKLLALGVGVGASAGCASDVRRTAAGGGPAHGRVATAAGYDVPDPGSLHGSLLSADIMVTARDALPGGVLRRIARLDGVEAIVSLGVSAAGFSGRTLDVGAVDPDTFRRTTPLGSAQDDAVWRRLSDGEAVLDPSVGRQVESPAGYLTMGQGAAARAVHIGAYAPLPKGVQAAVDRPRARELGIPLDNAAIISTGATTPSRLMRRVESVVAGLATVQELALEFDVKASRTAVLSGTTVPQAVGSFTYTRHPDGTVTPDARWVSQYIRTEQVPIVGSVTGNEAMFPQLTAALDDIGRLGLSGLIHPQEYGGCYVPRFIGHDPALGLSLHSWGIAVDLNVPENQRGTRGHMDPRIVATFKKWGFDWGGDWHYTDPMHFEMSSVVRSGS